MHPLEKAAVFIVLLATLIFVHELGHFLAAKLFRVKVLRFSLGFGPRLLSVTWGETEYRISVLPFGGYVKMAGDDPANEGEVPPADRGRGFLEQPPWKRGLIAAAGPAMSLLFPILAYFVAFYFQEVELSSRVGRVEPGSPAHAAGLRPGDRIVEVDGVPVRTFEELRNAVSPKWETPVLVTFERGGERATVNVVPERVEQSNPLETEVRGLIGVSPTASAAVVGVPSARSPAARAGLKSFDRIVQIDGAPVATFVELEDRLRAARGPVQVVAERDLPSASSKDPPPRQTLEARIEPVRGEDGRLDFGIESSELYVFEVDPGSPAFEAGLRPGDRLVALDGKPLEGFGVLERARRQQPERPLRLAWLRDGERFEAEILQRQELARDEFGNESLMLRFGAHRDLRLSSYVEGELIPVQITAMQALARAATVVPNEVRKVAKAIALLVTGQLSVKNIGGPIMMYEVAVRSAELGWEYFLQIMGFISVNLGLMNLLPIPVLDGFHILSASVEAVRRRPLGMQARIIANYIGLALLVGLTLLALHNDLMQFVF